MINYTEFECPVCDRGFRVETKRVRYELKKNPNKTFSCSSQCSNVMKMKMFSGVCENCLVEFTRRSSGSKDTGRFCSRGCAARHTSKSRIKVGKCKYCDNEVSSRKRIVCSDCSTGATVKEYSLSFLQEKYSTSQYHSKIRGHARSVFKSSGREYVCQVDGYSLHVDICHIKDVKDFDSDSKLSEVNNINNLVALCKRCHWEFDNGYLSI